VKGVVFNVVEDVVTDLLGADAWDAVLDDAGLGGAYTSLGQYDDSELDAIVHAAAARTGLAAGAVLALVGTHAYAHLAARASGLVEPYRDLASLLAALDEVVHPEVTKLYPGARPPSFQVETEPDGTVRLRYVSTRRLCRLAEGLVVGAARHLGGDATVEHRACLDHGADACVLAITPAA
jgi:hypothetical protein